MRKTKILIFIICDSYDARALALTLDSLTEQTYSLWQAFVISPNNSSSKKYKNKNIFFTKKLTLELLNSKLDRTLDEYISIIPQGTTFRLDAFEEVLSHALDADVIYSDEKNSTLNHYKPDWNIDYFTSYNYIGNAVFFSKHLLLSAQPYTLDDDQLAYHIIYNSLDKQTTIHHIPKILLNSPKTEPPIHRNKLDLTKSPLVSLIIPTKDQAVLLKQCITSIAKKTNYSNFEIIIVDNNSSEHEAIDYLATLTKQDNITILQYNKPFNYSAINNFAVKQAKGSLIALVNNDIEVINSTWLDEMVYHALRPEIGCVGAKLYYPDGTIQHGGVILGIKGTASHAHKHFPGDHPGYFNRLSVVHNVSAVTAACLVMRKSLFEEVGGFDEVNLKVAYNDVDLCLKVRELGYRNLWTPHAELIHHESKSRGKKRSWWQRRKLRKEARFLQKKWGDLLLNDPAYNPNLTLEKEDFSPRDKS